MGTMIVITIRCVVNGTDLSRGKSGQFNVVKLPNWGRCLPSIDLALARSKCGSTQGKRKCRSSRIVLHTRGKSSTGLENATLTRQQYSVRSSFGMVCCLP